MSNVKVTKREELSEEARKQSARPKRPERITRDMLRKPGPQDVPHQWREEGYVYRWMNARLNKGRRFAFYQNQGWELALDPNGNEIKADENDYLIRIPKDLHEQLEILHGEVRKEVTANREQKPLSDIYKDAGILTKEFTLKR